MGDGRRGWENRLGTDEKALDAIVRNLTLLAKQRH